MHRFYVNQPIREVGERVLLSPEESLHAARVLRLKAGERVCFLDGEQLWLAELTRVSEKETEGQVLQCLPSPEPPCRAVLWQGLPKADKLEWIVQKATELGCAEIWPVAMERSIARSDRGDRDEKKKERFNRIALEAAKQSGRARVPGVRGTLDMASALKAAREGDFSLILVAWEEEHALPLSRAVQAFVQEKGVPESVLLVVGPEGGISQEEYEAFRLIGGKAVTLGKRILRTETAGLCALSVLWASLGEM